MHDREADGLYLNSTDLRAAAPTALPAPPAPAHLSLHLSSLALDVELAFWEKTSAGLTALARFNCWAAARALIDIRDTFVRPLLPHASPDGRVLSAITAATEAITSQRLCDPSADQSNQQTHTSAYTPWPRNYVEAQRWLAELLRAYQETIGFIWAHHQEQRDAEGSPTYTLTRQCFALVEACEQVIHATGAYRNVVSWRPCSIVLPAYNEAENIGNTMTQCVAALGRVCPNYEVIVVDDGSHDATGAIADAAALENAAIIAVHNRPNRGYGGALLAGFAAAQGERLFFMDSDGQFDIREIATLLQIVESGQSPIAVGYRAKRSDPFMRKLNAWGWKISAKQVVGLKGIRDIDCAFKLLPMDALRSCQLIAQGASVNVEMLLKFQRMGLQIHQTPVRHMPRTMGSPTGAKPSVILRAFRELFRLRQHMRTWSPVQRVSLPPDNVLPFVEAPQQGSPMGRREGVSLSRERKFRN